MKTDNDIKQEQKNMEIEYYYRSVMDIGKGSSYGVVIPKKICESLGIRRGNYVRVSMGEDTKQIVIEKVE